MLTALGAASWQQSGIYRDYETLFRETLARNPSSAFVHNNLGVALMLLPGRVPDALTEFQAAVRLEPDSADFHDNLGLALASMPGRLPDAIAEYQTALRIDPDFQAAHLNLGLAWMSMPGHQQDAIAEYQKAIAEYQEDAPDRTRLLGAPPQPGDCLRADARPAGRRHRGVPGGPRDQARFRAGALPSGKHFPNHGPAGGGHRGVSNGAADQARSITKDVAVYKVERGVRTQISSEVRHDIPSNAWSILKVSVRGDKFQVYVNHRRILVSQDKTFTGPGKMGLWTVADSVTYFDDFRVYPK